MGGIVKASKQTGSARVYAILREEILRMQLSPGAPLDEVSLSERFGLSRSPIREALVRLSSEGLVVILPNRSTIVTPIDFEGLPHYLDALDLLQRAVTRLAALRRTEVDLKKILAAAEDCDQKVQETIATSDSLPMIQANHRFHMTVARSGKNAYYTSFYKRLLDEGRRMLHIHFQYKLLSPEGVRSIAADHGEIVDAIRARDPERAEQMAHAHAAQFRGRFLEFLERSITPPIRLEIKKASTKAAAAPPVSRGRRNAAVWTTAAKR
jgi:DNA-binding GntR family transcriptional regulator